QLRLELRQYFLDAVDDGDGIGAGLPLDGEVDRAHAVVPAGAAILLDAVVDARDLVQPDGAAIAIGDHDGTESVGVHQLAAGLDDEIAVRPEQRAGRPVRVGAGDRGRHLVDADLPRGQLRRIDIDADGELLRAEDI